MNGQKKPLTARKNRLDKPTLQQLASAAPARQLQEGRQEGQLQEGQLQEGRQEGRLQPGRPPPQSLLWDVHDPL